MITAMGAMRMAIEEARKGIGFVAPNPPVGCVILDKNGDLLAKGFHRIYGGDHAEIDAFKKVTDLNRLVGATFYVTLEPCAHENKTPSCAKALAKLPIEKVVYGLIDPHEKVRGQGLQILQQAQIAVEEMVGLKSELEQLAEVFLWNQRHHSPFVALKVATSLDGQMALNTGESRWITGEESRQHAHRLRAQYDALVIGKNTFLFDDPGLNIRHEEFLDQKNKVIILDTKGEIFSKLEKSKVFKTHGRENIFVAVAKGFKEISSFANVLLCDVGADGHISLKNLLQQSYERGIFSMLVEGGAEVLSSFLNEHRSQRIYQFIAPHIMGAKSGVSYTKDFSIVTLPDRYELKYAQFVSFGADMMITGRLDE